MIDIPSWSELIEFVTIQMKENQWFQTVGFFGILGIIWQYTRKAPEYLWQRIQRRFTYTVNIYETEEFYNYFEVWLSKHHKSSYRNVEIQFKQNVLEEDVVQNKEDENTQKGLKYKQYEDTFFIRKGFRWIKIWKGREKLENANNLKSAYLNRFEIKGVFSKRIINSFMDDVLKYNLLLQEQKNKQNIKIYVNEGSYWCRMDDIKPKSLDKVIVDNKEDFISDIKKFLSSKKWYEDRSILYKRGYLLLGKPGNGKTSLVMSTAKHISRDLYFLNPTGITNHELMRLYKDLQPNSILVFEDIDSMFNEKRSKKDKSVKFNFSTLLNCLDGAFSKEGVITIFTTNHPERLDPALIRAGRIDYKMTVSTPSIKNIEKYLSIFYEDNNIFIDYSGDNNDLSMVSIQDICLRNINDKNSAIKIITEKLQKENIETLINV